MAISWIQLEQVKPDCYEKTITEPLKLKSCSPTDSQFYWNCTWLEYQTELYSAVFPACNTFQ